MALRWFHGGEYIVHVGTFPGDGSGSIVVGFYSVEVQAGLKQVVMDCRLKATCVAPSPGVLALDPVDIPPAVAAPAVDIPPAVAAPAVDIPPAVEAPAEGMIVSRPGRPAASRTALIVQLRSTRQSSPPIKSIGLLGGDINKFFSGATSA